MGSGTMRSGRLGPWKTHSSTRLGSWPMTLMAYSFHAGSRVPRPQAGLFVEDSLERSVCAHNLIDRFSKGPVRRCHASARVLAAESSLHGRGSDACYTRWLSAMPPHA